MIAASVEAVVVTALVILVVVLLSVGDGKHD